MAKVMTFYDRIRYLGYEGIKAAYDNMGYKWYEGEYNLNIFGVRNQHGVVGMFDDVIGYAATIDGENTLFLSHATTDPGETYLIKPENPKGTAILVPGQYRGAYVIGVHARNNKNFAHQALVQNKPVRVYRDNNKDNSLDFNKASIDEGMFGINIHRASRWKDVERVGHYSAGCQVFQNAVSFVTFMDTVKKAADKYGNGFTYTLFTEEEVFA